MADLRSVVTIAATPRTGSNLVCRALEATGLFGTPSEYLLPEWLAQGIEAWGVPTPTALGRISQWYRRMRGDRMWRATRRLHADSVRRYLHRTARDRVGTSGTFCWKVMWYHYSLFGLDRAAEATRWGVPTRWIRIRRDDRLRQAVSLARAFETQQWLACQPVSREAEYDSALIARCEAMITAHEAGWDDYFARRGVEPLCVTYEMLAKDHDATIRRILAFLGEGGVAAPPPQLQRQADTLTEEWVARYRRERGDVPEKVG